MGEPIKAAVRMLGLRLREYAPVVFIAVFPTAWWLRRRARMAVEETVAPMTPPRQLS